MKKFFKVTGIITAALLTCGIFFVVLGVLSGGLNHTYKDNKWFNIVINPTVEKQEYTELDEFDSIKLDISMANVQIKKGDKFAVEYALYGNIKCEVKNNTLIVEENSDLVHIGLNFKTEDSYINIYVPENAVIDIEELNSGMGNIDIADVSFGDVNIEADMGNIFMNNVYVSNLDMEAGMGNIEFDGEISERLRVDSDMGDVVLEGKLACNAEVDASMGNVDIDTIYDIKMYEYNIDVDMGKQKINQSNGEIIDNEEFVWNINSDMGDVTINFGKK